jgi:competence protein ComEA
MVKKRLAALATLVAASALAAIDANTASQADLEAIGGVGPALSATIIDERKKGEFKDWSDLLGRVRGVGDRSAARLSTRGMTVNGQPYGGARPVEPAQASAPTAAAPSAAASAARK